MLEVGVFGTPLDGMTEDQRGIYERLCGENGPLLPPTTEGRPPVLRYKYTVPTPFSPLYTACGISWKQEDIRRFLSKCTWHYANNTWCLLFNGAKSRGKGNKAWYGSFWCKGKTVRAHKFFAVAILGLRPRPNREDELDHHCFNTRCVSCVVVLTYAENQKRIRRRKDYATG